MLNFGHTAGHDMEKKSNFTLTHGRTVAIDMAVVTRACIHRGIATSETKVILEELLACCDLSNTCTLSAEELARGAIADKKRRGGTITLVLPERPGKCVLRQMPTDQLESFFRDGL